MTERPHNNVSDRRRQDRPILLAIAGGVVALVVGAASHFILEFGRALEPMAPVETTTNVDETFAAEFPDIYHGLIELDAVAPASLCLQRSLGGRFAKLTLQRQESDVDAEMLRKAIADAFTRRGWRATALAPLISLETLVNARPAQTSDDDMQFVHDACTGEKSHASHSCRIHVSETGDVVVAYCETTW